MLEKTVPTVPDLFLEMLQFDVMNDKINDYFEVLVITANVSLNIH